MSRHDLFQTAEEAAAALREAVAEPPAIAVVLGSGLGTLVDRLADPVIIPYGRIPHFPQPDRRRPSRQPRGRLARPGPASGSCKGRFHSYEGHDLDAVTFPVRVLQRLGVTTLILTAATGGINPTLTPGDLVCLSDHLNLIGAQPAARAERRPARRRGSPT